jgi:Phage integrase family
MVGENTSRFLPPAASSPIRTASAGLQFRNVTPSAGVASSGWWVNTKSGPSQAPPYGRLTALRVGRLDVLRGAARVVEAALEIDGRLHWGGVKTHESRTVRLPRSISEELAADLAGRPRDPEALVFTAPLGGPLRPHTWVKSFFKPAVRAVGLPEGLRLYDLGHTCASLLIVQGASVKAVQAQLGHATASVTLDTYGHLFPSELEALADRLEQTRAAALANRARTQRGPAVIVLGESAGR